VETDEKHGAGSQMAARVVSYARSGKERITSAQRGQRPSAFAAVECFQQRGHFVPAASSAEAFTLSPTVTST